MKRGVLISTTEHLLSAFYRDRGIDNAIVELDNLELPILDGSARPFLDLDPQGWNFASGAPRTRLSPHSPGT